MKLVVGLGNPDLKYKNTRHNVGFMALDAILKDLNLDIQANSMNGDYVVSIINNEKVSLCFFGDSITEGCFEFNDDGSMVRPCSYNEIYDALKEEYQKLDSDYFLSYSSTPKPMYLLSWLYSQLQITGVTFPITNEANFNIDAPTSDMPFTIAHEMAHTKGVMREEDANLVAAYICLNSDNSYLRYSGYLTTYFSLYSLVQATNNEDMYKDFCNSLNPKIIKDVNYINNYWKSHDLLGSISKFFNDIYLMLSQSQTTEAYVDHEDTSSHQEGEKTIYKINSYSPYQGLLINYYLTKK